MPWILDALVHFKSVWISKLENKPIECPQQPETNKFKKHATSEICLLPSPSYSRGQACKAQSQHKHFMTLWNHSSNAFAILWQLKGQYSKLMWRVFPKKCCPPDSLLHLPNIHHPHLLRPLHQLHLLYIIIIISSSSSTSSSPSSSSPSPSPTPTPSPSPSASPSSWSSSLSSSPSSSISSISPTPSTSPTQTCPPTSST